MARQHLQLLRRTAQLAIQPAVHFFELATSLAALHESDPAFLENIQLRSGMSRRRLYYLLEVGQLLRKRGISRSEAEEIGWTKLQIISRYLTRFEGEAKDLEACFDLARGNQARNLPDVLRGKTVGGSRVVQFILSDDAGEELKEALLAFGAELSPGGLVHKDKALRNIVRAAMSQKPAAQ